MLETSIQALDNAAHGTRWAQLYVPESRFGVWFLGTRTWARHVLLRAIDDLDRLIQPRRASYPVIVDVGCGFGHSFAILAGRFRPTRIIGIEVDSEMLANSHREAQRCEIPVDLKRASAANLPLPDACADMLLCHQTFHHLIDQHRALREFHRVLKPDGVLLFAESTRKYINSWLIRLLFRHPMEVQRSAAEYLAMIRVAGFAVAPDAVSYPYLWWSRSDLALLERCFGIAPKSGHEETLINLVATPK